MIARQDISEDLGSIAEQIREGIRSGKFTWSEFQQSLAEKTKHAVQAADDFAHQNPWVVVGIGAGVGVAAGLLISNRDEVISKVQARLPKPESEQTDQERGTWQAVQGTILFIMSAVKAVQAFRNIRY